MSELGKTTINFQVWDTAGLSLEDGEWVDLQTLLGWLITAAVPFKNLLKVLCCTPRENSTAPTTTINPVGDSCLPDVFTTVDG